MMKVKNVIFGDNLFKISEFTLFKNYAKKEFLFFSRIIIVFFKP